MRRLGEIEDVPLSGEFAGYVIHIRHVGYGSVQRWDAEFEFARIHELSRLVKLRKELGLEPGCIESEKLFPAKLEDVQPVTPEGRKEDLRIARSVLDECIYKVSFPDGSFTDHPVDWLFARGLQAQAVVACIMQQTLRPTDPLAEGGGMLPQGTDPRDRHPGGGG